MRYLWNKFFDLLEFISKILFYVLDSITDELNK
jgi:hypothetical protein